MTGADVRVGGTVRGESLAAAVLAARVGRLSPPESDS